ncbi:MAG: mechanosensitive ion channel domain-containing protein [Bacteroidia bacterium]
MNEFLEYKFFNIGKFTLDVADFVKVFLILFIVKLILWVVAAYFRRRVKNNRIDKGSAFAIRQIISYFLWIAATLISMQAIGLNISLLLAGSAALLVGVGLGVQQTFNDFFSGIILLMEGSIKVDDVLEFDDMVCKVQKIGIRTSQVVTRDQIYVIVPNSKFTGDSVINWTHSQQAARFNVQVGVDYSSDVDLVTEILQEAAVEHPMVMDYPLPLIRFEEFADSSLNFGVYFWSEKVFNVEITKSELRYSIIKKFRERGVRIPFPQRDLHIKENSIVKIAGSNEPQSDK